MKSNFNHDHGLAEALWSVVGVALMGCLCACSGASSNEIEAEAAPTSPDASPPDAVVQDAELRSSHDYVSTERLLLAMQEAEPEVDCSVPLPDGEAAVVAPDGLDFEATCGNSPRPRLVEIRNAKKTAITYRASLSSNAFSVSPATGVVPSGCVVRLSVEPSPIPTEGSVGLRKADLVITTDGTDDAPHVFEVQLFVVGAVFKVLPYNVLPELPLDFGVGGSKSRTITIRNDGNVSGVIDARLTANTLNCYGIATPSPMVIAAGESASVTILANPPPGSPTVKKGTLGFTVDGPTCGRIPGLIPLTSTRP